MSIDVMWRVYDRGTPSLLTNDRLHCRRVSVVIVQISSRRLAALHTSTTPEGDIKATPTRHTTHNSNIVIVN